jgi:hypothetical protein
MIDEDAGARGLEAQLHLLARIDEGQRAAAEPAGRGMEIDVVGERVGVRIDQCQLEIVVLVHDHHRARHRTVVGHRLQGRAVLVDDHRLLLDGHGEFDDLGTTLGHLVVCVDERRRDELHLLARQSADLGFARNGGERHGGQHRGAGRRAHRAQQCLTSREHFSSPVPLLTGRAYARCILLL